MLVTTKNEPIGDADGGVEEAVEEQLEPDTLEETAAPDAEDTDGVSPVSVGDELGV